MPACRQQKPEVISTETGKCHFAPRLAPAETPSSAPTNVQVIVFAAIHSGGMMITSPPFRLHLTTIDRLVTTSLRSAPGSNRAERKTRRRSPVTGSDRCSFSPFTHKAPGQQAWSIPPKPTGFIMRKQMGFLLPAYLHSRS